MVEAFHLDGAAINVQSRRRSAIRGLLVRDSQRRPEIDL